MLRNTFGTYVLPISHAELTFLAVSQTILIVKGGHCLGDWRATLNGKTCSTYL